MESNARWVKVKQVIAQEIKDLDLCFAARHIVLIREKRDRIDDFTVTKHTSEVVKQVTETLSSNL